MPLTDQQLRQELLKLGETVPPITQRNREELRTRLDVLRARARSPVRARRTTSPTRAATRSKPVRGLIELSDSDTDFTAENNTPSRAQTRSVAVGRDTHVSPNVTVEVEESSEKPTLRSRSMTEGFLLQLLDIGERFNN